MLLLLSFALEFCNLLLKWKSENWERGSSVLIIMEMNKI